LPWLVALDGVQDVAANKSKHSSRTCAVRPQGQSLSPAAHRRGGKVNISMEILILHLAAMRRAGLALMLSILALHGVAVAAITNVVETGGDNEATDTIPAKFSGQTFPVTIAGEPVPGLTVGQTYTVGTFMSGAPAFVDRNHAYLNDVPNNLMIPAYLVGQQYIMSGNDNRDNAAYRLDVTVDTPSTVYMLIDNRLGGGGNGTPPTFGPTTMQWILDEAWTPTSNGLNRMMSTAIPDEVPIDEGADGGINQWYSVYSKNFPAGTVTLLQPDNAGQNMYGVVIAPSGPPPVLGDVDGDGTGGEFPDDFEPIRANCRMAGGRGMGDLSGNGIVDFPDFREWKAAFLGQGGSLAGLDLSLGGGVPEPSSLILSLMALAAIGTRRKKH
jgi:hypothetical protein